MFFFFFSVLNNVKNRSTQIRRVRDRKIDRGGKKHVFRCHKEDSPLFRYLVSIMPSKHFLFFSYGETRPYYFYKDAIFSHEIRERRKKEEKEIWKKQREILRGRRRNKDQIGGKQLLIKYTS